MIYINNINVYILHEIIIDLTHFPQVQISHKIQILHKISILNKIRYA